MRGLIVLQGDAQLFEVVGALEAPARFAGGLDGRQQERNQDANNRDDDQQFDQREAAAAGWHASATTATQPRTWTLEAKRERRNGLGHAGVQNGLEESGQLVARLRRIGGCGTRHGRRGLAIARDLRDSITSIANRPELPTIGVLEWDAE